MDISINNCDQMHSYANELSRNSTDLMDLMNRINAQGHAALENWNDKGAQNFMRELDEQKRVIAAIAQTMQSFATFVHRKANAAENAANQR